MSLKQYATLLPADAMTETFDCVDDPRVTFGFLHHHQVDLLARIRIGIIDLVAALERLECQVRHPSCSSGLRMAFDARKAELAALTLAAHRLQSKVDAAQAGKQAIKAHYTAVEAPQHIRALIADMSAEMAVALVAWRRAAQQL